MRVSQVTAITFVALGTSLPDTFASKAAAVNEPTADNSIGNITGSNSVNVFLGLGLPWCACTHAHAHMHTHAHAPAQRAVHTHTHTRARAHAHWPITSHAWCDVVG